MGTCVLFVYTCKSACSCVYLAVLTYCLAICLFPMCWFCFSYMYTYWINDFWFLISDYHDRMGMLSALMVSCEWNLPVSLHKGIAIRSSDVFVFRCGYLEHDVERTVPMLVIWTFLWHHCNDYKISTLWHANKAVIVKSWMELISGGRV